MIKDIIKKIYLCLLWKTNKTNIKQVVFSSFSGESYSDNPKAISECLHKLDENIEIVWLTKDGVVGEIPDYVTQINIMNPKSHYKALATAKVIVDNFGFMDMPKKKEQKYIQTWHGDRAFKKVLCDSPFVTKKTLPESRPGFCDLAIAGSDYGERQFKSAFRYPGVVLKKGTPRDDQLVYSTTDIINAMKEKIGLDINVNYLLYAPTLRRVNQTNKTKQHIQSIDVLRIIKILEKKTGEKWACLLRAHPAVGGLTGVSETADIKDVSDYPDMADLLLVSDMLITDYSSCAGDFALTKRPLFLFQDDIDEYLEKDRTFYFDMQDSPYYIAHSQEELEALICKIDAEVAKENCESILSFYGTCESGEASLEVAKLIKTWCNNAAN